MRLRDETGQILIIAALAQVVFLVIVGFAVDYGFWLLERQRLQNAVDAASLAGARALVDGASPGIDAARATTLDYLSRHGYVTDADTSVSVTFPVGAGGAVESVAVHVDQTRDTYFVRLVGVDEVELGAQATAAVDRRMIDIMLSLDLTASMELSGATHLPALRDAVAAFVNIVNPSPSSPLGPKIGMARFAGVMCQWNRRDADLTIDLDNGEYVGPCADDMSVLHNLTLDKGRLIKLATNAGGGSCPNGNAIYACPLQSWRFTQPIVVPNKYGAASPTGMTGYPGYTPDYTGTKLPNGINVVANPTTGYYAWSTANGARNNATGEGYARKVLVMFTDGQNELWPRTGNPAPIGGWNAEVRNRANAVKLGPDGVANTQDDVEIYTIGYFCTPYSSDPNSWCKSELAADPAPRACPGATLPGDASSVDVLLRDVSSSAPGACDRYFPIRKGEDLPEMFRTIAGAITRGRLTQ
jgi:Flp pilus assembly protein TadG